MTSIIIPQPRKYATDQKQFLDSESNNDLTNVCASFCDFETFVFSVIEFLNGIHLYRVFGT